jgi:hypothetical protein
MAEVVGGDLYHLWTVSEVHLPRIASVFYGAGGIMGLPGTDLYIPASDSGSLLPPVSAVENAWYAFRSELQSLMIEMGDVVMDAAQGVRHATEVFDHVDAANGRSILDAYMATEHDAADIPSNPPAPGDPDRPRRPAAS